MPSSLAKTIPQQREEEMEKKSERWHEWTLLAQHGELKTEFVKNRL